MERTLTVEQAIEFLEGCLPAGDSMKVTSLVVSCEVGADDMPVEEPETHSGFHNGLRGS